MHGDKLLYDVAIVASVTGGQMLLLVLLPQSPLFLLLLLLLGEDGEMGRSDGIVGPNLKRICLLSVLVLRSYGIKHAYALLPSSYPQSFSIFC